MAWPARCTGTPPDAFAMLRSRSRRAAVGAKQGGGGFVVEPPAAAALSPRYSSSSPAAASVFPSPRPFLAAAMALPHATFSDAAEGPGPAVSRTSTLETKPFLSQRRDAAAPEPAGVGLADVLREHGDAKAGGRKVVFGSQLRIQVPSSGRAGGELVSSPIEFGVKNRDAQLAVLSPARRLLPEAAVSAPSARVSPVEMAMSEDYTCVISRGPNPRTRHIFDDCIVESCGDVLVEKVGARDDEAARLRQVVS